MENSLIEKIEIWLKKEGYPLEFRASECFEKAGFVTKRGMFAKSINSEKQREIDILAEFTIAVEKSLLRLSLVVECKYIRDHPWIVFAKENNRIAPSANIAQTIANDMGDTLLWMISGATELHKLSMFNPKELPCFGGTTAFRNKEDSKPDYFYSSLQSIVSKSVAIAEEYSNTPLKNRMDYAQILMPIIVIDGEICECTYDDSKLSLKMIDQARINWRGAEMRDIHSVVDIVTIEALPQFLDRRHEEAQKLIERLSKAYLDLLHINTYDKLSKLKIQQGSTGYMGKPKLLSEFEKSLLS